MVVIGIIGGMAVCAPPCAAGMEVAPPNGMAAAVALVDGAAQADGTDNAPTEVARPILAETAGAPAPKPVEASALVPEPSPADWAAPNSLAAALTVRAALAVLPAVKSLDSMLIGIVAIRNGVLRVLSIDSADVEDDDDESVVEDVRVAKLWGEARLCRA
jgi:hypothetical protein